MRGEKESATLVCHSGIEYILLRLTWLYDDPTNRNYELVPSGEPFADAEVSREAVTQAIMDVIANSTIAWNTSYGVGEPGTNYSKPSFY